MIGTHNKSYLDDLQALIRDGYKNKLMLLQGFDTPDKGFLDLGLSWVTDPGLFVAKRFNGVEHRSLGYCHRSRESLRNDGESFSDHSRIWDSDPESTHEGPSREEIYGASILHIQ